MIEVAALVDKFRLDLGNTIITYLRKLDAFSTTKDVRLMTAPDNDIVLPSSKMYLGLPVISDRDCKKVPLRFIALIKGEFYVTTEAGAEFREGELSLSELVDIACSLELEWQAQIARTEK